jgi:hypothetical protein
MGAIGVPTTIVMFVGMICTTVVLPVIVPAVLLYKYFFGPAVTITAAFLAFPCVFITTGLLFAILFTILINTGKGNLVKASQPLYPGVPGEGWSPVEVLYFSVSTLIKGAPQYEASGWCRWLALVEVLVGRLLELAMVTIGFAIIIKQNIPAGPHT